MWVKLLGDHGGGRTAGTVMNLPEPEARRLIEEGRAVATEAEIETAAVAPPSTREDPEHMRRVAWGSRR
jgi:hypothetical protein